MIITVVVPTYRRVEDLARCLEALQKQKRRPDSLLIAVRDSDEETRRFLRNCAGMTPVPQIVTVCEGGVIAAMQAGVDAAEGDIIALTDDDAMPWPDWLEKIEARFQSDDRIGGVGGRDWVYHGEKLEEGAESSTVGKIQWFGRLIGNHHLGVGPAREVEELKGVNCAYRADLLKIHGFDRRLAGTGAQVYWELSLGIRIRRSGCKLIYDPAISVDHGRGKRHDEDRRDSFNPQAQRNRVYNETLILTEYLPPLRKIVYLAWACGIGTGVSPGILQCLRHLLRRDRNAPRRLLATLSGRYSGAAKALFIHRKS